MRQFAASLFENDTVPNKDTRFMSMLSFRCLYCELWPDFAHCSGLSIVDFEQVSAGWVATFLQILLPSDANKVIESSQLKKILILLFSNFQTKYFSRILTRDILNVVRNFLKEEKVNK